MLTEKGQENVRGKIVESYHTEHRDVLSYALEENPELTIEEVAEIMKADLEKKTSELLDHYEWELFARIVRGILYGIDYQKLAEELMEEKQSFL